MFETILIANRGEIACRIIATCRRMGIRAIAVYSDADAEEPPRAAGRRRGANWAAAFARELPQHRAHSRVPPKQTGAQAIHPGYGFLSENAEFAEACAAAGMVFIGPPAAAIRAMGSKAAAKELMRKAGVPLTPGYDGADQSPEFLAAAGGRRSATRS